LYWRAIADRCGAAFSAFGRARGGGVALLTALALPPLILLTLGAVQLQAVVSAKSRLSDAADAAALWGAQQLTISEAGVTERVEAWAMAQLGDLATNALDLTITSTMEDKRVLRVRIDANLPSFFMNALPKGGFALSSEAVAEGLSQSPLCILTTGTASGERLTMMNQSKLRGDECLVHSNRDISVAGTAMLKALQVETVNGAAGPITPSASTDAPLREDPFAQVNINFPVNCPLTLPVVTLTSATLQPGVHCFNYDIQSNTTLTLAPGNHYFGGYLRMKAHSKLVGTDVVLVFSPTSGIEFKNAADIKLSGRQTGPLAGFVMAVSRGNTGQFVLEADSISEVTGAIYVPNAVLKVSGSGQAAKNSQWTVVAAKAFELSGTPELIINADYSGTVPVPAGVGNRSGVTHLIQ